MGALLLALLNLHPTMYLLILFALLLFFYAASVFTSHYVSINSETSLKHKYCIETYLHPTMYLLIPDHKPGLFFLLSYLHPTMYLLIPASTTVWIPALTIIYIPLCIY